MAVKKSPPRKPVKKSASKKAVKKSVPKKSTKKSTKKATDRKRAAPKKATAKKASSQSKKKAPEKRTASARKNLFISLMSDPHITVKDAAAQAGYSENAASTIGSRVLAQVDVQEAVSRARMSLAARCGITAERVMQELWAMGSSNMLDYVDVSDKTGEVTVNLAKMTRVQASAVQEIKIEEFMDRTGEVDEDGKPEYERVKRTTFKLHAKEGPLTKIAKHLGIKGFDSKLELSGPNGGPIPIIAANMVQNLSLGHLKLLAAGIDPDEYVPEEHEGTIIEGEVAP